MKLLTIELRTLEGVPSLSMQEFAKRDLES